MGNITDADGLHVIDALRLFEEILIVMAFNGSLVCVRSVARWHILSGIVFFLNLPKWYPTFLFRIIFYILKICIVP